MAQLTWNDVQEKIEDLGYKWNGASSNGDLYQIDIQKYSLEGQDCNFTLQCDKDNPSSVAKAFYELYENYDPESETMLWLGEDGHGKNGAPYHMRDLLEDMEAVQEDLEDSAIKMTSFCNGFEKEYSKEEIGKLFIEDLVMRNCENTVEEKYAISAAKNTMTHIIEDYPGSPKQKKELLGEFLKEIGITDNSEKTYATALNKAIKINRELLLTNHNLDTVKHTMSSTQVKVHRMLDKLFNEASDEMNPIEYAQFCLDAGNFPSKTEQRYSGEQWWEKAINHAVERGGEMWHDNFELVKMFYENNLLDGATDSFLQSLSKKEQKELTKLVSEVKDCVTDYESINKTAREVYKKINDSVSEAEFFNDVNFFQNEKLMKQIIPLDSETNLKYNRYISKRDDFLFENYGENITKRYGKAMHMYLKDLAVLDNKARDKKIEKNREMESRYSR